jgi:P4 family phage/plasmid primase-like protien
MDSRLQSFVDARSVGKGESHTHVSLMGGKYNILGDDLVEFQNLYNQVIARGGISTIAESPLTIVPLIVDIDYNFPLDNGCTRLYTAETLRSLIQIYREIIDATITDAKPYHKYCCVLEKTKPRVDRGQGKDGFHLHFPYVYMEQWVQKDHVRARAIAMAKSRGVFKGILPEHQSLDKVFDDGVPRNAWLLYGSRKTPTSEAYLASKFYNDQDEKIPLKSFFKHSPFLMEGEKPTSERLPSYLSIRVNCEATPLIYGAVQRPKKARKASEISEDDINKPSRTNRTHDKIVSDVVIARGLVELLDSSRAENYNKWFQVGCIIYNISEGCKDGRELWHDFSMKCIEKYDKAFCDNVWDTKMELRDITLGSLNHLAKCDSPNEYAARKKDIVSKMLDDGISQTNNDIAKVLHTIYEDRYVCVDPERDVWYEFRGHRWVRVPKGITLRMRLSDVLVDHYAAKSSEFSRKVQETDDPQLKQNLAAKSVMCGQLIAKLKSNGFKTAVMKEAMEYFYDEKFIEKMDENKNLMVFENGVYDAAAREFREGRPDDYCTKSTHRFYYEFQEDDKKVLEFQNLLEKIFVNPRLRKFFVQTLCSLIRGGNRYKMFLFWTGQSNNGKSVIADLLAHGFGDYHYTPPTSLITGKRGQSGGATAELIPLKGARAAVMSETSRDDTINEGVMKMLSGGDAIYARGLFKDPVRIVPQNVPILHCNKLPGMSSEDTGSWNRAYVLMFESVFVPKEEAPKTSAEQFRQKKFPMDLTLKDRLESFADVFMWFMIKNYEKYADVGLEVPQEVRDATKNYRKSNDHYLQFVEERLDHTKDKANFMTHTATYSAFQTYFKESFPKKANDIPSKNDAVEALEKIMGKSTVYREWLGWKLRSLGQHRGDEAAVEVEVEDQIDAEDLEGLEEAEARAEAEAADDEIEDLEEPEVRPIAVADPDDELEDL